jgi:hypothetical protein
MNVLHSLRRSAPRFLAASALCAGLSFALPSPALALGDWIKFEASFWQQSLDGSAAIDDSIAGTEVNFKDDLGISDAAGVGMARVRFRFGRNSILLDYFNSSHEGSATGQSFTFAGVTYGPGETIRTSADLTNYSFQYRFDVLKLKVFDMGLGLGAAKSSIRMDLNGSTSGSAKLSEDVPYPTLNVAFAVKPLPGFAIRAEASGAVGHASGTSVDILDLRAQIEYYFAHVFGIYGGYRSYRFDVEDDSFGAYDTTYKGPYVGLGLKF